MMEESTHTRYLESERQVFLRRLRMYYEEWTKIKELTLESKKTTELKTKEL